MRAKRLIVGFIAAAGLLNAKAQTPAPPPADTATPPMVAAPAQPLVISRVELSGNTVVQAADILNEIGLKAGETLTAEGWQRDADAIERLYTKRGFQAVVQPMEPSMDGVVHFRIVESIVDSLEVKGNKHTRRDTILRVADLPVGVLYRRDAAQESVKRLYNLGIFDDVTYRLEPGKQPGGVTILYQIDEAKTGSVDAGFGYSGDSGLIGQLAVEERNLGGRAQAVGAFVQSGGKFYRSGFQLQFHDPFVDNRNTALDVGAYAKTVYRLTGNEFFNSILDTSRGYDEFRTGGDFSFSRRISQTITGAVGFRGNGVQAHYAYDIPALGFAEGRNPGIRDGSVYVGTLAFADDHRDYAPDPGRGYIRVLALEGGTARTDGQTFLYGAGEGDVPLSVDEPGESGSIRRVSLDWRHYYGGRGRTPDKPTKEVPVLATRLVAGSVSGEVPFWEQFFVGGIGYGGVRYARFLSGDNAYEDPFVTSSQALRGYTEGRFWGRNMLVGSIEFRYPIGEGTRLVAFTDAGDAWGNDVKVLDPYQIDPDQQDGTLKVHASVGLGLRVATPIGAFRVDFGVGSEGSRTHVSIGQVF